ncbi:MAG: glycoside hydrolase family 15 protein [Vicinamibacteria bacterium]
MPARIEDYALIGDCQTAALVCRDGSIDWLCFPRFDSGACFAALLGTRENGRWLLAPSGEVRATRRRYRDETLVLETEFETDTGSVTVVDCMPPRSERVDLVRVVVGRRGRVAMRTEIAIRFDYGWLVPWVRREGSGIVAVAGPDMLHLQSDVPLRGENFHTVGDFEIEEGESRAFVLTWHPSYQPSPGPIDGPQAVRDTEKWWRKWASRCTFESEWRDAVVRSLITLKALTYAPTGGMVAAATTSLPELIGGVRNWDYRYCWIRDATFTLYALLMNGYRDEARAWREWLLRAIAGKASQLSIMYGVAGERRLTELELEWLPGYEGSRPVRIGNAAHEQFQLDVFGEIADTLHLARRVGLSTSADGWRVERSLLDFLESRWQEPDEGIWEMRGPRRHFTHSKLMAWVAFDRAARDVEKFGLEGPVERWRALRDEIHAEVCAKGYDAELSAFVQYYGGKNLDASLLMMCQVGFLPPTDPRVAGTIAAIERFLADDGFVRRYSAGGDVDGLPHGEGAFLLCTFWLADNYALLGRTEDARRLFERLLSIRNDVGLLSEEYDPRAGRLLGNFPQAFSHVGLVNTARNLSRMEGPAEDRKKS